MGFIASSNTIYATAYLTEVGRQYLFDQNNIRFDANGNDLFQIVTFTLGDPDVNYQVQLPGNLLSSGQVPDISGKGEVGASSLKIVSGDSLKTTNYIQNSLLVYQGSISQLATSFGSVSYYNSLRNNQIVIDVDSL